MGEKKNFPVNNSRESRNKSAGAAFLASPQQEANSCSAPSPDPGGSASEATTFSDFHLSARLVCVGAVYR